MTAKTSKVKKQKISEDILEKLDRANLIISGVFSHDTSFKDVFGLLKELKSLQLEKHEDGQVPDLSKIFSLLFLVFDKLVEQHKVSVEKEREKEKFLMEIKSEIAQVRSRHEEDLKKERELANQNLARDFLEVSDSVLLCQQAIAQKSSKLSNDHLPKALEVVVSRAKHIFSRHGIERIACSIGDKYDVNLHRAVDVKEGGNNQFVLSIVKDGYLMNGFVLRPVLVITSSSVDKQ